MLLSQFLIQLGFECLRVFCAIVAGWYGLCLALKMGGAELDEALDVIIIDVVWCRVTNQ